MMFPALLLAVAPQGSTPESATSPKLPETLDEVIDYVVPGPEELAWRSVPWRPTLYDGLRDGAREEKPVLLWAMNGHPLGST